MGMLEKILSSPSMIAKAKEMIEGNIFPNISAHKKTFEKDLKEGETQVVITLIETEGTFIYMISAVDKFFKPMRLLQKGLLIELFNLANNEKKG